MESYLCKSVVFFSPAKKNRFFFKEFPNITQNVNLADSYSKNATFIAKSVSFQVRARELVNYTYNNAEWLGFRKTTAKRTLPMLVEWNIIYILTVTLWTVVMVRQFNYRMKRGRSTERPFFMFPKIKRSDADKNLVKCVQYLFNFAFYKFGIEVSVNNFDFVAVYIQSNKFCL